MTVWEMVIIILVTALAVTITACTVIQKIFFECRKTTQAKNKAAAETGKIISEAVTKLIDSLKEMTTKKKEDNSVRYADLLKEEMKKD
jgi:uncharacterized membrane protein YraQ (UPF0718 family)